jgi:hypothetical protein
MEGSVVVPYRKLSRAGQIDFEILQRDLERRLWLAENTRPFESDPRIYNSYINDSTYLILTQSTLPLETNVANCIARIRQIPRVIAAARENLRQPPRPILDTAIRQNRGAIGYYEKELFELAGASRQLDALKAAAAPVVAQLKDYQNFLEHDLAPRATGVGQGALRPAGWSSAPFTAARHCRKPKPNSSASNAISMRSPGSCGAATSPQVLPLDGDGRRATTRQVLGEGTAAAPEDLVTDARATSIIRRSFAIDLSGCPNRSLPGDRAGVQARQLLAYLESAPPRPNPPSALCDQPSRIGTPGG